MAENVMPGARFFLIVESWGNATVKIAMAKVVYT